MIDEIRFREIASEEKVPLGTIEKDYAISCALNVLSNSGLRDHLVFKGGTAIKKIYYPEARFSEDMDFTVLSIGEEDVVSTLQHLFHERAVEMISFGEAYEERFSRTGRRLRLPFTGPLRFRNSIRIDMSFREDIILDTRKQAVLHKYGEAFSTELNVLDFKEIIAEKLRALMERGYPRDYYDIWFHVDRIQDKIALRKLTERKCAQLNIEYRPDVIFEESILERVESLWKTQLQRLLPNYTDFRDIFPELKAKLNFL